MPVYKRKGSPYYWFSITIDGVRFRRSTRCTGKREAELAEAHALHEASTRRKRSEPWRLRDCLGAYWQEHARHTRSADGIFVKLDALSRILGKDTLIEDISNSDLMDYRAVRVTEGLAPHGVNRDFSYLKAALRHANTMHGKDIPAIAWSKIRISEPHHRIRFLSREEYHRLLDASDETGKLIVKFAVATGLRKANILELDWKQVDLDSGIITVMLKGNKRHTVRMPPPIRAALSTLDHRSGKVFDTTGFRKRFEKAVKAAGLTDFRFHDLRHTCATWMRMAGTDIADICEALGHSSVAVTMRYAHIEPEEHISPFDRISDRVWSHSASQNDGQAKKA